jgi:hypothetical protein
MSRPLPLSNCSAFTLVDDADFLFLSQWAWRRSTKGYVVRSETINGKRVYMNLHRVIMNAPRGLYVDHIDNDKLNNTRSNLRLCTQSQNQANRRLHKNNSSGFKGVTRRGNRWHARIWVQEKQIHLGYHDKAYQASMLYDHAARRFFGEFARLNHPDMPRMLSYEEKLDRILAQHEPVKPPLRKPNAPYVPRGKSRHRGVYWDRGRWRASIYRDGRKQHLGYFTSEDDAARAYEAARFSPPDGAL